MIASPCQSLSQRTLTVLLECIRVRARVPPEILAGDKGNTVVTIEHNMDILKSADYILDIGSEGGAGGGRLVAKGTPEDIANNPKSYTGRYLRRVSKETK